MRIARRLEQWLGIGVPGIRGRSPNKLNQIENFPVPRSLG